MKIILLGLAILLSNLSEAQKNSHEDAVNYYVKLTNNTKSAFVVMSQFANEISNYTKTFSSNQAKFINEGKIDSMRNHCQSLIITINKLKDSLTILPEVDTSLKYKQYVIDIYTAITSAIDTVSNRLIGILIKGVGNTTEAEFNNFKEFFQKTFASVFEQIEPLTQIDATFKNHFNITNEELIANGL